jgi:hypothetical protein
MILLALLLALQPREVVRTCESGCSEKERFYGCRPGSVGIARLAKSNREIPRHLKSQITEYALPATNSSRIVPNTSRPLSQEFIPCPNLKMQWSLTRSSNLP